MQPTSPDPYTVLGLDRQCTDAQITSAYRLLAKQHHPDAKGGAVDSVARIQAINAAYEILGDPVRRRAFDRERSASRNHGNSVARGAARQPPIHEEVQLRIEELLRGTTLRVQVNDPSHPDGPEVLELIVPPDTAPGTRFRVARTGDFEGGCVAVRVKARPDARFKVRGCDLRCDLPIRFQRAAQGGAETIRGAAGNLIRVDIPRGIARGGIIRVPGEGLPRPRGGRGDLLVRVMYRPEVHITRAPSR